MKRAQLKQLHSGKVVVITNLERQVNPSVCNPELALDGRKIIEMSQRGVLPTNNLRYYEGVPIEHMMPIDNPNIDIFQGMEYARSKVRDTKSLLGKIKEQKENNSTTDVEPTN